ncbi:PREDICTED: ataxin-2 homolog [Drosophila arizonae]|uniref:Ataxin-2 homolog n=1 Tax=Drosophila arizonae TaxID=7263 RepID=A0ABM1PQN9_DROAR|nr:PREDICTED: ataxin-2 homolog [Drosophila arizonae]
MRAFIVTCLLGMSLAKPQGYNYQAGRIPGLAGLQQQQQGASLDEQRLLQQALEAPKVQQLLSTQPTQSQQVFQQPLILQQPQPQQQQQQQIYQQPQQQHQIFQQQASNFGYNQLAQHQAYSPVVSKDIYVHVPPAEEPEERYPQPVLPVGPPRKHYRIVFIKAPTPSVSKAAVRVQQAPVEEKTIIYVLTKKPDPLELQTAIEEAAPKPISKPEVFFIKYKTQEEAAHAQRTIQAQYDQLGGTTQVSDEGVAPVTSVIGSLDNQSGRVSVAGVGTAGTGSTASIGGLTGTIPNKYLPAHLRT